MKKKLIKIKVEGTPGKTPVKSVDYFTLEEQAQFVAEIMSKIVIPAPVPGTPGKDAVVDYSKIEKFVKKEIAKIPKPEVKESEVIDTDSIVETVLKKLPKQKGIDYKAIKEYCLEEIERIENNRDTRYRQLNSGGPTTRLGEVVDVSVDGATAGQVLIFNGSEWVPGVDVGTLTIESFETFNKNLKTYPYEITEVSSTVTTITYDTGGTPIIKTITEVSPTVTTIGLSGIPAGLPTIKTITETSPTLITITYA